MSLSINKCYIKLHRLKVFFWLSLSLKLKNYFRKKWNLKSAIVIFNVTVLSMTQTWSITWPLCDSRATYTKTIFYNTVATFCSPTWASSGWWSCDIEHVTKRWLYAVGKLYAPPSLFMQVGSFRIQIDSLTCLVFRCPSLSKTLAPDQFMTWFSFATWSVMADLFIFAALLFKSDRVNVLLLIDSTSFLCSSCLFP